MPDWEYQVHSITLDNFDDVPAALQSALAPYESEGLELVSCFPEPQHFSGQLHEIPNPSEGSKPYDNVWNTPTGPSFVAIFKRPIGD